jgi:acyl transferase domain-containing protein
MVNNFSAAVCLSFLIFFQVFFVLILRHLQGGNSSLIVRDAPLLETRQDRAELKEHLFVFSAHTPRAFADGALRLKSHLATLEPTALSNVCYTSTAGRRHHPLRVAGLVRSFDQIAALLDSDPVHVPSETYGVAWAFTGQGSQWIGMGRDLYAISPAFRNAIDQCNRLAIAHGFEEFLSVILPADGDAIPSPAAFQLAIFSLEYALAAVWTEAGARPSVVGGHSLGEYAALTVAGVLTLADAIYLVGHRAALMVDRCTAGISAMLAVHASTDTLADLVATNCGPDSEIEVACLNSSTDTVFAGPREAVQKLAAHIKSELASQGARCMVLDTPYAFHSRAIDPILEAYAERAALVRFRAPRIPVLSNLVGRLVSVGDGSVFGPDYLVNHARKPVRFSDALTDLDVQGDLKIATWLELGPHPTVGPMIKACAGGAQANVVATLRRNSPGCPALLTAQRALYLSGVDNDWRAFHTALGTDADRVTTLPPYAFDQKEYWIDFRVRFFPPAIVISLAHSEH